MNRNFVVIFCLLFSSCASLEPHKTWKTIPVHGGERRYYILSEEGKTWGKYNKKYDGEGYITLEMESSWDSDVIGINKTAGTFVRTIQGIEGGKFQYAIAQKGYCE